MVGEPNSISNKREQRRYFSLILTHANSPQRYPRNAGYRGTAKGNERNSRFSRNFSCESPIHPRLGTTTTTGFIVINATLHPPETRPENAVEIYRAAIALARQEQAKTLAATRKRAKTHSKRSKEAGYQAGYQKGIEAGRQEFKEALEALRGHYRSAVDQAREDVNTIAHNIVAHVIENYTREHPEQLRDWITHALSQLQNTRGLTLRYHPRYHELLGPFIDEYKDVMRSLKDPTLGDRDFSIQTDSGEISFAWREMLQSLSHNRANGELRA